LKVALFLSMIFISVQGQASETPNIIMIVVDTLRVDRVGAFGFPSNATPNLDAFLKKGVLFTQARTSEPLTAPSMISVMTSLYPHEHGASRNGLRMYPNQLSFSRILMSMGYHTNAILGNWTLRDGLTGMAEHFDEYHEILKRKRWFGLIGAESTAHDITESGLAYLKRRNEAEPFFLWLHYADPHAPYKAHKEYADQLGMSKKEARSPDKVQRYDMEVAFTDHSIGDFLTALPKYTDMKNTLVVFMADHGENLGEHGVIGHGRHLYEDALRVPLAMVWEDRIAAQTISEPAVLLDIAPTLLGLLSKHIPSNFQGYDWSGVLLGRDKPETGRTTYYQAHRGVAHGRVAKRSRERGLLEVAVLKDGLKESFRTKNLAHKAFDLNVDPNELASLVVKKSGFSEALKVWALEVEKGLHKAMDRPSNLTESDVEMLRSLGYIE